VVLLDDVHEIAANVCPLCSAPATTIIHRLGTDEYRMFSKEDAEVVVQRYREHNPASIVKIQPILRLPNSYTRKPKRGRKVRRK
jgi:hypothetical protein